MQTKRHPWGVCLEPVCRLAGRLHDRGAPLFHVRMHRLVRGSAQPFGVEVKSEMHFSSSVAEVEVFKRRKTNSAEPRKHARPHTSAGGPGRGV